MLSKISPEASGKSSNNLSKLTFGVELEFLTYRPPHTRGAEEHIAMHLLKPITVPCNKPGCIEGAHKWRLPVREPYRSHKNAYDYWNISSDGSVDADMATEAIAIDGSVGWPVEIQSRILNFQGKTPCPFGQVYPCTGEPLEWEWRDEITAIVDGITRAYSKPGYRACVNSSAGMHVHIGNGMSLMPTEVVKGVTGTFTALERLVDEILPTSRNYAYEGHFRLPGVNMKNRVHIYEEPERWWITYCKGMASVLFKHSEVNLINELEKSPDDQSEALLEEAVRSINVPAWLELIRQQPSRRAMERLWVSKDPFFICADGHESAVNLENLEGEKGTIEIRAHQASLDTEEITAWVDLMGKTALWTDSPADVFAYLLTVWADPNYSILDFAKHVGTDASTISHYTAKLQPDFAKDRFNRLIAAPNNREDELNAFTRAVEFNRYLDFRRTSVLDKIQWKTLTGRYGQMPASYLNEVVPQYIRDTRHGSHLDLDNCDWKSWFSYSVGNYRRSMITLTEAHKKHMAEVDAMWSKGVLDSDKTSSSDTTTTESSNPSVEIADDRGRFGVDYPSDESPSSGTDNPETKDDSDREEALSFGEGDSDRFEASTEAEPLLPSGGGVLRVVNPDPESAEAEDETAIEDVTDSIVPTESDDRGRDTDGFEDVAL